MLWQQPAHGPGYRTRGQSRCRGYNVALTSVSARPQKILYELAPEFFPPRCLGWLSAEKITSQYFPDDGLHRSSGRRDLAVPLARPPKKLLRARLNHTFSGPGI